LNEGANICARVGCENLFSKKTHNQKYCSDECCRIATNAKIMERYYENKRRRSGAKRLCDCGATLSKYNLGDECSTCEAKRETNRKYMVMSQMAVIVWES
jgi:hypothetical protein